MKRILIKAAAVLMALVFLLASCNKSPDNDDPGNGTVPHITDTGVDKFITEKNKTGITITGYSGIESVISVPEKIDGQPVTEIAENAFRDFKFLKKVVIPDSVKTIDSAFVSCSDLYEVYIGKGVTSMKGAFRNCTALVTVSGYTSAVYMDEAFYGCTALKNGYIPLTAKSCLSTYYGCGSLASVVISNGIKTLNKTFENCSSLASVTVPESVTDAISAFKGCSALSDFSGGENIHVYNEAFSGCTSLLSFTLGINVTELVSAFTGCTFLSTVTNQPREVNKYASSYTGCKSLKEINIPAIRDNESLENYTVADEFEGCSAVTVINCYLDIPVKEEFCKTFSGCRSLESLQITGKTAKEFLRVSYTITDSVYTGSDKNITDMAASCKKAQTARVTDNYALVNGVQYTHIYGGDLGTFDIEKELSSADVTSFTPYTKESSWCGYPTGEDRKKDTVAILRTYSFFLRTTGINEGSLPETLIINGVYCVVGENK